MVVFANNESENARGGGSLRIHAEDHRKRTRKQSGLVLPPTSGTWDILNISLDFVRKTCPTLCGTNVWDKITSGTDWRPYG